MVNFSKLGAGAEVELFLILSRTNGVKPINVFHQKVSKHLQAISFH